LIGDATRVDAFANAPSKTVAMVVLELKAQPEEHRTLDQSAPRSTRSRGKNNRGYKSATRATKIPKSRTLNLKKWKNGRTDSEMEIPNKRQAPTPTPHPIITIEASRTALRRNRRNSSTIRGWL